MTAVPPLSGLSAALEGIEGLFCDIWGVLHNGEAAWPGAVAALQRARAQGLRVVLVSNAPVPAGTVAERLAALGVPGTAYDGIVTSGDLTRAGLERDHPGAKIVHIGAPRDMPLLDGLDIHRVGDDDGALVVCTGLHDDTRETPEDYDARLKALAARGLPMLCANPDLVVERGERLIFCAGALARRYEEHGGTVTQLGKPHKAIYDAALQALGTAPGATLALGDSAMTDLAGAAEHGLQALFVTGGIHAGLFGAPEAPDPGKVAAFLTEKKLKPRGFLARLVW
ncbi:MAG: TIGR01459 family HAD-type hydrolase [Hyphomicrobiaceae bacterium]|nr:TIGR01459 family HAD-type hydrolase [Hyphomicrobiaceae bacterium]